MKPDKAYRNFLNQVEIWEEALGKYSLEELLKQPEEGSWSLGQVYMHLISATLDFQLPQAETCMNTSENSSSGKNFRGFMTYRILGGFPPVQIKVPPSKTYTPKQPQSREQIEQGLAEVRERMKQVFEGLSQNKSKGKTKHPGLGFLNAREWFALVPMHFKHHLHQKKRLDAFLETV